eukprot:COSAG01_NODE_669_length_14379_cov_292.353011_2_plen_287_part_00
MLANIRKCIAVLWALDNQTQWLPFQVCTGTVYSWERTYGMIKVDGLPGDHLFCPGTQDGTQLTPGSHVNFQVEPNLKKPGHMMAGKVQLVQATEAGRKVLDVSLLEPEPEPEPPRQDQEVAFAAWRPHASKSAQKNAKRRAKKLAQRMAGAHTAADSSSAAVEAASQPEAQPSVDYVHKITEQLRQIDQLKRMLEAGTDLDESQRAKVAKEQKLRRDLSELLDFSSEHIEGKRVYLVLKKTIVRKEAQMSADISPEVRRLDKGAQIVAVSVTSRASLCTVIMHERT